MTVRFSTPLDVTFSDSRTDTVISFHEYPGQVKDPAHLKAMRSNTLSVLRQLSNVGLDKTTPLSVQSVRYALKSDDGVLPSQTTPDIEGSSLLLYYLFDDWRAVYSTVGKFHDRLNTLVSKSYPLLFDP
jgi:hypothetical protein